MPKVTDERTPSQRALWEQELTRVQAVPVNLYYGEQCVFAAALLEARAQTAEECARFAEQFAEVAEGPGITSALAISAEAKRRAAEYRAAIPKEVKG